jgi:putative phage-type endonuclease
MKIVKLAQGSPEWHQHRKLHRNASETPAVLGVSPWLTPYQLWLQRTSRAEPRINPAMRRGSELEPLARQAYEQLTGLVMEPLVLVDEEYSASLDGITLAGDLVLEIKCPVKGKQSELWQEVQSGQLPEHYVLQVQHQLMVAGAELAHVYVFSGTDGVLLEQRPDPGLWSSIRAGWDRFMEFIDADLPPPLTERDIAIRSDDAWLSAAGAYAEAKGRADAVAVELDAARERLLSLLSHASERGGGVVVTRYWKQGRIDCEKIAELQRVDVEPFRKAGRYETRVCLDKQK